MGDWSQVLPQSGSARLPVGWRFTTHLSHLVHAANKLHMTTSPSPTNAPALRNASRKRY